MNSDIGAGDIAAYRRDGYVKITGFLDTAELAQLRDTIEAAVAARTERIPGFADAGVTGDAYYDNVFKQRVNLWRTDEATRRFILDERIGGIAARLEDQPAMRLYHDQALFKGPWANPTSWHLDNPYWAFHSRNATTIWIALDDVTVQNGALLFMPRSHLSARYDNVRLGPNVGALFDVYPQWAALDATCVELKAGDATFHNGLLAHAAGPNMTPRPRRAYAAIFMPDGSRFNGTRNVLPQRLFESLKPGDLLDDDDFNPVVFPANR
jgi:ectoine hydroxylase-related dioxygenase (phytanoyl-CoA dioxygenase family)